jgi:hypothetical protein
MFTHVNPFHAVRFLLVPSLLGMICNAAMAIPSYESTDSRLPNPDHPYEWGSVAPVHAFSIRRSDPSQLDTPTQNADGNLEFDSTFDFTFSAIINIPTPPPYPIHGTGTARIVGIAPYDPVMQIFEMELLEFAATAPSHGFTFLESPTQRSRGVLIRENTCPECPNQFTNWKISSFLDAFLEYVGQPVPPAKPYHLVQAHDFFLDGDYNKDNVVDAADYVTWRRAIGQTGAGLAADGNWSGTVDMDDFDAWRGNFGRARAVPGGGASTAVPELGTVALLLGSLAALICQRIRLHPFLSANRQRKGFDRCHRASF